MKLLLVFLVAIGVVFLGLPLVVVAVLGSYPWLAAGALMGTVAVHDNRPPAVAGGVPAAQWSLMVSAAHTSSCGVAAEDLAAIARIESDFGQNLRTTRSGAFGYGQFDVPTWAAFGAGNPDDPADAIPAIVRTLCARGYATDRTRALNSYGGCTAPRCLGASDYATAVSHLPAALKPVQGIVQAAQQWLGVPYVFGGCSRSGIDCSCLVQLVFGSMSIKLPRVASDQWNAVQHITPEELQPGDLVFFHDTYMPGISHVGIYISGNQQINAPAEGQVVSVAHISISLPSVDWATLIPQLVGYFFEGVATYVNDTMHGVFDGIWGNSSNVLSQTDLAMTWDFGPVHDQVVGLQTAARAILLFALILLGLRSMLAGIMPRQSSGVSEFINGILGAVILVTAFPVLIPEVIRMTNSAAVAIGSADLSAYVGTGGVSNPLAQAVLFIMLVFFAIRLLIKAVWRIGFLAVLLPVGMLACALYAVPQTRWLLGWWAKLWGGMLLAQIPSVMALAIGTQLFAHGSGVGSFVFSIAFLQLATDLYSVIPFGRLESNSAPWGALPSRVSGALGGHVGAAVGAGTTAARALWSGGASSVSSGSTGSTYGYQ